MLYKYSTVKADYQICTAGGSRPVNTTITACKDAKHCTSTALAKMLSTARILQYYNTTLLNTIITA